MQNNQERTADELKEMLEQRNYWSRIHAGKLLSKVQDTDPARIIKGGISQIISYYDEHLQYLCTFHIIKAADGSVLHEHVKDAEIDGVRYKVIQVYW